MKIETVALEDQQTKLIAELDSETLEKYKRQAARKISQKQKFPGFRPGKAPYDLVRRMIGDEALTQEAIELMLDDVYPQVLQESGVNPSGPGKLEEIVKMDPPTFAFVVPLPPSVDLGNYAEIRKDYAPVEVTEEQVDATLLRLQRSYSTAEPVERPAQKGDLVSFNLNAKRINPEEGENDMLVEETPYQMVAGEEEGDADEIWPYAGFTEELVGVSADETKVINHTFSDESPYEDLRGKETAFTITVQSIKEMHLPELNDEFAQTLGEFENVEALRKAVRSQLEQNNAQQYDQNYFEELIDSVVEQATVKYPPHMLEEEIEQFLHGVEHNLEHDRLDLDTYLKMREMDRETFIETEVKPAAERRLVRSLVLEEFAKQEKVEVKSEEIQSIYYNALQQMQQSNELRQIQSRNKQSSREMANSIAMNTVNNIFNARIMGRLKAIAMGKGDEAPEEISLPEMVDLSAAEEMLEAVDQSETTDQPEGLLEAVEATAAGENSPITSEQEAIEEQAAAEADLLEADLLSEEPAQADQETDKPAAGENEA